MNFLKRWITIGCMTLICGACSNESKEAEEFKCDAEHLCPGDQVCANAKCIDRCNGISCGEGEACSHMGLCLPASLVECSDYVPCAESNKKCVEGHCVAKQNTPECSESNPCTDTSKTCTNGQCVPKDEPECSESNPCKDITKTCTDGHCVPNIEPECSQNNPCEDTTKKCTDGQCVPKICYGDKECGDGYICDHTNCIPEDSCTRTRKCKDSRVCRDGKCIDMPVPACSKTIACPDESQTCIAGKCIVCNCSADETCEPDGSCLPKNHIAIKNANVGDACKYTSDYIDCDGNRLVTCSQVSGQEDHATVKLTDCGAKVCARASEDGVACYETCPNEGDFYGECLQDYNSESGTTQGIAFHSVCEKTQDNKLIWTYTGAPEYCKYRCDSGNCIYIPEEYGAACTMGITKDKCVGDWLLFCDKPGGSGNAVIFAENCAEYYDTPHECMLDRNGDGSCVIPCTQEDASKTKNICSFYLNSAWYSDSVSCKPGQNGSYYWFSNGYTPCNASCDITTGECK